MTSEHPTAITDAEVRSLAAKLQALSHLLTPQERALLRVALGRAAGWEQRSGDEVEGFAWRITGDPFLSLARIDLDSPARRDRRTYVRQRLNELR